MKLQTRIVLGVLLLVLCFTLAEIARSPKEEDISRIYFFDVGQGDAALIQKGDIQILIDGGPDEKILQELGKTMPLSDRKIDFVILSHPHADHLVGLNAVLDRYQVGMIFSSGVAHTSDSYLLFLQKIKDRSISYEVPEIGESLVPFGNGSLEFIWPGKEYAGKTVDNLNNTSEVAKFCYFSSCVFLTGDAEVEEQNAMFDYYDQNKKDYNWQSQIFKVAHHGSLNAINKRMYEKVLPSNSIISVGADNKYGHPHDAALGLAEEHNSTILRTDRDGTIKFMVGKEGTVQVK